MEAYLDASERGAPFHEEHTGFARKKHIDIPDRPTYGKFTYVKFTYIRHIRPVKSTAEK